MVAWRNSVQEQHRLIVAAIQLWKHRCEVRERWSQPASLHSRKAKARNIQRDRAYGLRVMAEMTDYNFQRMFRMSRIAFGKLLRKLSPHLTKSAVMAINSSGQPISIVTRQVASRWFAL